MRPKARTAAERARTVTIAQASEELNLTVTNVMTLYQRHAILRRGYRKVGAALPRVTTESLAHAKRILGHPMPEPDQADWLAPYEKGTT